MTEAGGEKAVVTSALIVFGVYFYRHLTEGTTSIDNGVKQLLGYGTPANLGRFVTAWGFIFLTLAIINSAAPGVGGSFAILVATGDVLANGAQVASDVNKKLGTPQTTTPASAITSTVAQAPLHTTG